MKKIVSAVLAAVIGASCCTGLLAGCTNETFDDYYTFSVGSIPGEMLVNTSQKLDPVVRNLGEIVDDPTYSVEIVTSAGEDVTADTYDAYEKLFTPTEIDVYDISFTATDAAGTPLENSKGETFTKKVQIDVVKLDIEPVTTMDEEGVTIDHDNISITFDSSLETPREEDVKQYKLTGVSFAGNFRLSFDVSDLGFSPTQDAPKIFVGFKRDTIEREDDSFGFDPKNKTFNSWMKGVSAGEGWKNTTNGWQETENRVQRSDGTHEICISRFIDHLSATAYWTIEFDGEPMNYINAGAQYTENVVTVYFTTFLVSGTIGNISFTRLDEDNEAPVIAAGKTEFGREVDLTQCAVVTDNQTGNGFCRIGYTLKDEEGAPIELDGKTVFLPGEEGTYTLHVEAADLVGNSAEADLTFRCGAIADLSALPTEYLVGQSKAISFSVENAFATVNKGQVRARVFGADGEEFPVGGSYLKGNLSLTVAKTETYTLQVFYQGELIAGKEIKGVERATKAPVIGFEDMTDIARTHLGHGVYFSAYDAVDGDLTETASVTFKRAQAGGYQDVTGEVYDAENRAFRPNVAGVYSMTVSAENSAGLRTERSMSVRVRDDVQTIYGVAEIDFGIDMSYITDESLSTTTIYRDGFRFAGMSDRLISPKFNIIPVGIEKDWSVYFEATDLGCAPQSDGTSTPVAVLGMVLILGNSLYEAPLGFDTFTIEGKPKDDVWGWGSTVIGASSIAYAWASWGNSWYASKASDEFNPNGQKIAGGSHWTYLGTHSFRLRCRTSEEGVITFYTYIDEVLFAVHNTSGFLGKSVTAHNGYNQLLGFQFCSKFMEGTVKNIRFTNE